LTEKKQDWAKKSDLTNKPEICENRLLCPEEWKGRPGERVLAEYHKDGFATGTDIEEADLESFEKYWNNKSEGNLSSEYHKEGAPHLHESWVIIEKKPLLAHETIIDEGLKKEERIGGGAIAEEMKTGGTTQQEAVDSSVINRPIDIHTLEVISYAVVRALFSQGISLPIKREGMMDMELTVKGKDITLDTKELFPFTVPELTIWRVIYAYKGKPVLELGRGVKKGFKIHPFRGLVMLVDIWRGNRRQRSMKKRVERARQGGEVG
jgi:hypothetical protein